MNKLSVWLMLLCFCNAQLISSAIPINIQAAISLQIDADHLELSKSDANIWIRLGLLLSSGHPGTRGIAGKAAAQVAQLTEATTAQPTEATTAQPTEATTAQPTEATAAQPTEATAAQPTEATTAQPTVATTTAPFALTLLATTTTALPTTSTVTACQSQFVAVGAHCYYFSRGKATFNDASLACHSLGAALAHPNNAQDNSRLTHYLRHNKPSGNHWWIGANDRDSEGQWVWSHDNSPLGYSNWSSGEPNDAYENEDCAQLRSFNNYKWNDVPCNNRFQYICQQHSADDVSQPHHASPFESQGTTTTAAPLIVSKSDFVQLGDHKYYFSTSTASFDEATKACQSIDTTLAHPDNAKDNALITDYIRNYRETTNIQSWWIGATDRDTEGQWVWVHDESPLGYSDWSSGEPNDGYENEDCAQLRRAVNYDWNDAPCGNKYNYICQYQNLNTDTQSELSGEVDGSGDDTPDVKLILPDSYRNYWLLSENETPYDFD